MAKIHKLSKNGQTIYPATTTDAVVNPSTKKSVTKELTELENERTIINANQILNTRDAITLQQAKEAVPVNKRTRGMLLIYKEADRLYRVKMYVGSNNAQTDYWISDDYWRDVLTTDDYNELYNLLYAKSNQSKSVGLFSQTDLQRKRLPKLNIGELTNGRYKRDGSFVSDTSFKCTSKIDIIENATMIIALKGSNNAYSNRVNSYAPILFFDAEDNLIDDGSDFPLFDSRIYNNSTHGDYIGVLSSFTTPANAKKIILTGVVPNATDTEYIKKSDIISVYLDERKNYPIMSIDGISNSPIEYSLDGKFIDGNGDVKSNALYMATDKIEVSKGDCFYLKTKGYNVARYAIYDSNDSALYVEKNASDQTVYEEKIIIQNENAKYIRFSREKAFSDGYVYKVKGNLIDYINEAIKFQIQNIDLSDVGFEVQKDFDFIWIDGEFTSISDGTIGTNGSYYRTNEIKVQQGDKYYYKLNSYNTNIYGVYTADGTLLQSESIAASGDGATKEGTIEITQSLIESGADYLIFCGRKNRPENVLKKIVSNTIVESIQSINNEIDAIKASDFYNLIMDGDSLTYGQEGGGTTYGTELAELIRSNSDIKSKYNILNFGSPGDNTLMILSRMGVVSLITETEFTIPADKVESSEFKLWYGYDTSYISGTSQGQYIWPTFFQNVANPVCINGIEGNLIGQPITTGEDPNYYPYKFIRLEAGKQNIVRKGTQILTKCGKYIKDFHILYMGANGGFKKGSSNSAIESSDIEEYMKQCELADSYCKGNLIYLTSHFIRTNHVFTSDELENRMLNRFGNRYINVRRYFSTNAIQDGIDYGILPEDFTPTEEDLQEMEAGNCPYSLLADDKTHFNANGYRLLGRLIYNRLLLLGVLK